jgi:LmbE family N-acetylglucosaminyl deacetylase
VDEAAGHLVEIIREVRPQVLVTYDPDGCYLHPDHRLAIERRSGRRLALEPAPLAGAMLISTRDTDLIIYDQAADTDQQLQLIGHEVAHLVLGHQPHEHPSPLTT